MNDMTKTLGISLVVAVIASLVTNHGSEQARVCEYRSQIVEQILDLTTSHTFYLQNKLGVPFICYTPNGQPWLKIEGDFNQSSLTFDEAEHAAAEIGEIGQKLNDKTYLYISSLQRSSISHKHIQNADSTDWIIPYIQSGQTLKVQFAYEEYATAANAFMAKCGNDGEYHEMWKNIQEKKNNFKHEILALNNDCFSQFNILAILWNFGVIGVFVYCVLKRKEIQKFLDAQVIQAKNKWRTKK